MAPSNFWQGLAKYARQHLLWRNFVSHYLSCYVYHSLPINPRNCGKPLANLYVRNTAKGNLRPVWRADKHGLDGSKRVAFVSRVAHHHADIVFASLNALRFVAVKCMANLCPQV